MLLRLPWLLSRKRLLASAFVDISLFSLLYIGDFLFRFRSLPGFSLPVAVLVALWLLISYVIGRYQGVFTAVGGHIFPSPLRTVLALVITIGLSFLFLWFSSAVFGSSDSRGYLLPLLLRFAFFSYACQLLFAKSDHVNRQQPLQWLLLGSAETLKSLDKQMMWRRLSASVDLYCEYKHSQALEAGDRLGVLLSDFSVLSIQQEHQLLRLQSKGVLVLSLFAWCEQVLQRFPPELLSNADVLRGEFVLLGSTMQMRLKRLGDLFVSVSLLVLTAPILATASVLIRLQDGGPVLYGQLRSGLDGKPYRIWKLRTMHVNAERNGAQWVGKGDPRITPLGRLLRLTRLDELPQLWSVIKGEMSLIGPRPERPEFEQDLQRQIPHYRLRHLMRPGLSGWAQVNYPYGASVEDAANKLSYDLYYLRNFSFLLDLLILFKTIRLVFTAQGAVPISDETNKL